MSDQHENKNKVTISIDPGIEAKIHQLRSTLIKETNQNWYFSQVLNLLLADGFKRRTNKKWIAVLLGAMSK